MMIRKARRPSPARPPLLAAFLASCRGVTSVELALTLPVLLAMIFLVIDLQRLSLTDSLLRRTGGHIDPPGGQAVTLPLPSEAEVLAGLQSGIGGGLPDWLELAGLTVARTGIENAPSGDWLFVTYRLAYTPPLISPVGFLIPADVRRRQSHHVVTLRLAPQQGG